MIEVTHDQIQEWAETKFEGLDKDRLRASCRFLGIEMGPATTAPSMKLKLQKHFGFVSDTPSVKDVPRATFRSPPNFKILESWAGRKYRIKVHAPDAQYGNRPYFVAWEGQSYTMDPRKPYQDVPAPIYFNIVDAKKVDVKKEWDAATQSMREDRIESNRYPYTFLGYTPGTESLPDDAVGWFKRDAQAHDFYAYEKEDTLERIWSYLTDGQRPNKDDRDRNVDYWRRQILQLLELTPEQIEMREAWNAQQMAEAA